MLDATDDRGTIAVRIVACEDRLAAAAAEVFDDPAGRVYRQPAYPSVFDANLARNPRLTAADLDDQLLRLAAPLRAIGASHLQLTFDAAPPPPTVAAALRARDFHRDRLLAMVLPGRPARRPRLDLSVEAVNVNTALADYATILDSLSREEPWYTPAVAAQIVGSLASKAMTPASQLFVARWDGLAVAAAGLAFAGAADPGVAAIHTVGTIEGMRRRGVAQTLVVTLAAEARARGCDLVYLIARADDTPKDMYRKLGFETGFGFDVFLKHPF